MPESETELAAESPAMETPQWATRTRYVAAVLLLIASAALLYFLKPIWPVLCAAFLFAFLFDYPIRLLCRRTRLTYGRAMAILYGIAFAILAVLFFGSFSRFFADLDRMAAALKEALPAFVAQLQAALAGAEAGQALPSGSGWALGVDAVNEGARIVAAILGAPRAVFGSVVTAVAHIGFSVFLSLMIVANLHKARGSLEKWVPAGFSREVTLLLGWLDQIWQRYLAAEAIFALALGAFSIFWFWLLGAPFPVLLSILSALLALIPIIGGLLSGLVVLVPCALLGSSRLVGMSPVVFGLMMALIHSVLIQITYNFIALPVMGKMVRLPFWVVLTGVALGLALGNILLAFLVIPLFSTFRVVGRYFLSKIAQQEPFPNQEPLPADRVGFFGQMYTRERG